MIKLHEEKQRTSLLAIGRLKLPEKVILPLSQHIGKICQPLVKVGDSVKTGQLIATLDEKVVFSPIHSSISGTVLALDDLAHPLLGRAKAMVIASNGLDEKIDFKPRVPSEIEHLTPHDIRKMIFDCGIVGMGGAGFPTHIKLSPPKHLDSFILNGAECEPYLNADNRLMIEKADEIILAISLIVKCTGVKNAYVAIEDNKPEAIKVFENKLKNTPYTLYILKSGYPQGGEKQLIKAVLKKELPPGKLPFDAGAVVNNVATAYAVYEAVYLGKPLYERVITITGDCIEHPGNYLVRLGTCVRDLMAQCGPFTEEPERIVFGGPMMGIAQHSLDTPVIKSTNGVIFLAKSEIKPAEDAFCIRCGRCVEACPLGLMPCMIALAVEKQKWDLAKSYGALECMECGSCSYVCPQRRNVVEAVKYAKQRIPK